MLEDDARLKRSLVSLKMLVLCCCGDDVGGLDNHMNGLERFLRGPSVSCSRR